MGTFENAGHAITFKVSKDDVQTIIFRSNSCLVDDPFASNLHIDPTTMSAIVKPRQDAFADDDTDSADSSTIPDDDNY